MRRKVETERETTTYIVSGVLGIMETQQVKTMACETLLQYLQYGVLGNKGGTNMEHEMMENQRKRKWNTQRDVNFCIILGLGIVDHQTQKKWSMKWRLLQ